MKKVVRGAVLWLLKTMAKWRLRKYEGTIIAVTGSIGKTSTKEAIYKVLNSQFKVKRSAKSMNSDFGLPLTILDIESGYNSATKWTWFLMKAFVHCFMKEYSDVLLVEFGIDKPGDMNFLTSIVKPDIVVMTEITPVHMAEGQFASLKEMVEEEKQVFKYFGDGNLAIMNMDNPHIAAIAKQLGKRKVIGFGSSREADYRPSAITSSLEGVKFSLLHKKDRFDVESGVLGKYNANVILPAFICGMVMKMPVDQVLEAIKRFKLPPGRMSLLPAINEASIIDSSYNSSPNALSAALDVLEEVGDGHRRVAVIGDMNELGDKTQEMHEQIGKLVPKRADMLITVGNKAKYVADAAEGAGMSKDDIFKFKTVKAATEFFEEEIRKGDIVLVKGSQNNVRLEKFVKGIMLHPEDAKELLVRQEKIWMNKL